jgi:hypothetical protein
VVAAPLITNSLTVRELLLGRDPVGTIRRRLAETVALGALSQGEPVADAVRARAWRQVADAAAAASDIDLGSILVGSWRTHQALLEAAASTRLTTAAMVVPMGSRRVSLARRPVVEVAGAPPVRVEVAVDVDLTGVAAVLRGGALIAVTGGRCEVTASLSVSGVCLARRVASVDPSLAVPPADGVVLALPEQPGADRLWHRHHPARPSRY